MAIFDAEDDPVEKVSTSHIFETIGTIVGCLAYVVILLVFLVLIGALFRGLPWFAENVQPTINLVCLVLILILVPLSFLLAVFRKTRPVAGLGFTIASYVVGFNLWLLALIVAYFLAGVVWMIVGVFIGGVGVVPIAVVAAFINADWTTGVTIIVLVAIAYGLRAVGLYLIEEEEH